MKNFISLLVVGLLCGCSRHHSVIGQGDAGQFILQTAIQLGGHPVTTNNLPPVSNHWSYSKGKNGIIIDLDSQEFPAVEAFLHQSFGAPSGGNPGKNGYYHLATNGAMIYFTAITHSAQIIIVNN